MKKPLATSSSEPQRRLSIVRVLFALLLIALLSVGSTWAVKSWRSEQAMSVHQPWFAAYVDVTSTPRYAFEQLGATSTPQVVLAFIVADKNDPCTPSWGSYYTLDEAANGLDLDRRIARLQQQGGKLAVSFGGLLNDELAVACTDEAKLAHAYNAVIQRYTIDTIDLDLENNGLNDKEAAVRRAKVIAQLQAQRRAEGKNLAVWVTLPVAPQGLTQAGTDAVATLLANGVDLAGVNVMTMDYGQSKEQGQSMFDASQKALTQTHRQLGILYKNAGLSLNSRTLWRKLGATPMIGQNDVIDEVFGIDDAEHFNSFAMTQGLGRMSMWSANRDVPCGENYVDTKVVSDSCSGVKVEKFKFMQVLSQGFSGDISQNAAIVTSADPESNTQTVDDPAKSPYQIWREDGAYPEGVKVVWHGNVYEAKWWTKGDMPDNPVLQAWETPWQLVGPVLAGEKPVIQPTVPAGTYPVWEGTVEYRAGERVLFEGIPFQAKWWNQGQSPAASAANSDASPWAPLTQPQIQYILKELESQTIATKSAKVSTSSAKTSTRSAAPKRTATPSSQTAP